MSVIEPWLDLALPLIQQVEGFSATPYRCPAGVWTVGWGHALSSAEHAQWQFPMDPHYAQTLLMADLRQTHGGVMRHTAVVLHDHEAAALCSFVYNVGLAAYQRSTLRQCLHRGEYDCIPTELNRWVWANGRRLKGLIHRRALEGRLFMGGGLCG